VEKRQQAMISAIRSWQKNKDNPLSDPHFWVIVVIYTGITLLYYCYYYTDLNLHGFWRQWFWRVTIFEYRYDMHGSLFYIPLLYVLFIYWWRGLVMTWIITMILLVPHILRYAPDVSSIYTNIIFLSVPLVVVGFINAEVKWRNRERKMLAAREAERQVYMSQIFKAQEDERQRIAQELHDDTLQTLLVIANRAQTLVSEGNPTNSPQIKENAEWIRDTLLYVSEDMRRLSLDLRPSILDNIGLAPAIRWLAERFQKESNIVTQVTIDGEVKKLNPESEVSLFRIVQEALNNIRKHAKASKASINLDFSSEEVKIVIKDNGKGFSVPRMVGALAGKGKLGLIGMQQRAKFLNGTFKISSESGKGTTVSITIHSESAKEPEH
jgi:signal transduction histidine kinase